MTETLAARDVAVDERRSAVPPPLAPLASAELLDSASLGLALAAPELSARRRLSLAQKALLPAALAALGWSLWRFPRETLHVLAAAAFWLFAALTMWRLLAAGAAIARLPYPRGHWQDALPVYTILCPLYREAHMIAPLLARLGALDYPADKLDLKLVLESDDRETLDAANAMALPAHVEVIATPSGLPRTKPKALNYALKFARGQFVTIFDAEDAPDPRQLRAALDAFAEGGEDMGCVQAPLLIDNAPASWLATQFAAEYAIQFRGVLPLLARTGRPLMLGGTSNHFRASALAGCGGWDPFNVTEDADIGYRLARDGWRSAMIAPATWEEAPVGLTPWLRQRTRWLKGHMQTWLVLMRDPIAVAREMGWLSFAMTQFTLGGAIVSAFAHLPILITLAAAAALESIELSWAHWALALAGYCTAAYSAITAAADLRQPRIAFAALTMPLYWPLSTLAAAAAVFGILFRPHYWAKTEHGVSPRPDEAL
ncbi:MAG: glycosyltransferase [Hyphomonadaceae bacterium]